MDYIYKSFEKQYLQHAILRILLEKGPMNIHNISTEMLILFSKDNINEVMRVRPYNEMFLGLIDEIKVLLKLGFVAKPEPDVMEITKEGLELLKQELIKPDFSGAYNQWRVVNINQNSVELAKISAKWSRNAAFIAMISTLITTILTLIQIFK